jgi:hypothetical protein
VQTEEGGRINVAQDPGAFQVDRKLLLVRPCRFAGDIDDHFLGFPSVVVIGLKVAFQDDLYAEGVGARVRIKVPEMVATRREGQLFVGTLPVE